jgi:threonine/homoserine/homoserine lactone efflux protein
MGIFISSLLVGYSGAMMPGPLLTYSIERSLKRGWLTGVLVTIGHALLELLVVALFAFGLGRLLDQAWPRIIILFLGGLVLLWFGVDMVRGAVKGSVELKLRQADRVRGGNLEIMFKSAAISLLNPYFLLWWATVGLGFLTSSSAALGLWGILLFYLGHILADFTWYFAVSVLCDRVGHFIGGKVYRWIIASLGVLLGFFAVKFIIDGIGLILSL